TKTAVSSVAHLLVTDYPVVNEEKNENGSPATAQKVSFPVAICGMCERGEDVDYYQLTGTAGQEITVNLYAQRVTKAIHSMQSGGSGASVMYLMDSILTLYGSNGQVITENDNFIGGDSFLTCKLPEDGDYFLEVRDTRYIGNPKYVYCVTIDDKPFAHAVFPMAVQRGQTIEATVIGHNLGGVKKTTVRSAADDSPGWKKVPIETPRGLTNPVPILVSSYPQLVAADGNFSIAQAMPLSLPVGVNGRLSKPDEVHYYSFQATKDRYYLLEIESDRRDLPLDSVIDIYDSAGKRVIGADDGYYTKDAQLYFKAPSDGRFIVSVRDLHNRGGERFVYNLRVEPSGPDFEVHGKYYYAQLAPGTRMIWFARLSRINGFNGPVEMQIEGLPEGVSLTPVTIPAGLNQCALILSAQADAKVDACLVRLFGKAVIPDADGKPRDVIRDAHITCELQASGGSQARWPINTQIVGVTEPLDLLKFVATPSEITLRPGEKAEIKVRVERSKEYTGPITLAMPFLYGNSIVTGQLPRGVTMSSESKARLTENMVEGTIILEAATGKKAPKPLERFPIAVMGRIAMSFSISTNYASNPIHLTISDASSKADR
ncbi:MAG: PPC domain-containing protein, partial [Planctomycetes bacterium]|nr:PPC domain-containing protein [Planctomycetota bacterium]